jgi:anti-anti-sigma regulatory factor
MAKVAVIELGQRADAAAIRTFESNVAKALAAGDRLLLIDAKGVSADSTLVASVVSAHKATRARGGWLAVRSRQTTLGQLLHRYGLGHYIDVTHAG